ncbi:MAG: DinB family protein [Treponema sp.]|nr:DinB family protein [Treponema sp.]
MQKDIFVMFANYNKAADEKMNSVIKTLSPQEWNKDLGGYFKSVRGVCSHLYVGDFNWLKRFSELREFQVMKQPPLNRGPHSYSELLFEDMNEYFTQRSMLDEKIISFVGELKDEDLKAGLKYSDSHGAVHEKNFGGLVMNSFNHGTHHRGMISLYLELLNRPNDFSSFSVVL